MEIPINPPDASLKGGRLPTRLAGAPWSIRDAAEFLGVCRRHLARLAGDGRVKTIQIGGRRLIPDVEVQRVASEGCG